MKRGGKRAGAGRKLIYGEPTIQIGFKVPKSKSKEFKEFCKNKLKEYVLFTIN